MTCLALVCPILLSHCKENTSTHPSLFQAGNRILQNKLQYCIQVLVSFSPSFSFNLETGNMVIGRSNTSGKMRKSIKKWMIKCLGNIAYGICKWVLDNSSTWCWLIWFRRHRNEREGFIYWLILRRKNW